MTRLLMLAAALALASPALAQRGAVRVAIGGAAPVVAVRPVGSFHRPHVVTTSLFVNPVQATGYGFPYSPGYGLPQFPFNNGLPIYGSGYGFGYGGYGYAGPAFGGSYLGSAALGGGSGLVAFGGFGTSAGSPAFASSSIPFELTPSAPVNFVATNDGPVRYAGRAAPPGTAMVTVRLPANAELYVQGQPTHQTGPERVFVTPPLGGPTTLEFTVRKTENGKPTERIVAVAVKPGDHSSVQVLR